MDRRHCCPFPEYARVFCRSIQRKVKDFFSFFTCSMSDLCNFPGEIYSTSSEVASVACDRYRVTLEVLLRFFVRQHVDPFVANATQIDGTAFDTITRTIFWFFLCLCRVYGTRWCVVISPTSRRHNSHDGILLTLMYADYGAAFFYV